MGYWGVPVQEGVSYTVSLYLRTPEVQRASCSMLSAWSHACMNVAPLTELAACAHDAYLLPGCCPAQSAPMAVTVALVSAGHTQHYATLDLSGVGPAWKKFSGVLVSSATGGCGRE